MAKKNKKSKEVNQNILKINNRINNEYCEDTNNKLKDENLMDEYMKSNSFQRELTKLTKILEKHNINEDITKSIITDYTVELIPAGTKGVIRGNKFNSIIKDEIINLKLDEKLYEICFEKQCESCITSEKPDWYILEKSTKKVIIGMNQLDLWKGGAQSNRGSKYIIDNKSNNSKLLCVVCNKIEFSNNTKNDNKTLKLFDIGFTNDTLCYLKNLKNIIITYFS